MSVSSWSQENETLSSRDTLYVVKSGLNSFNYYLGDKEIDSKDIASLFRENDEAYKYFLKSSTITVSSVILQIAAGSTVAFQLARFLVYHYSRWNFAIAGGAVILITTVFFRRAAYKNIKKAVKAYNEGNATFEE